MRLHIWSEGDNAVGIPGRTATVTIDCMEDWHKDEPVLAKELREDVRKTLTEAFRGIFDENVVHVVYEDELL